MKRPLKKKIVGYAVTVEDKATGLALCSGGADIVSEGRCSLKGTRLYYDTVVTVFSSRRSARRAIERTKRAVAAGAEEYRVVPLVVLK